MTTLTAHKLTAQQGARLLEEFYGAWESAAPGQMERSYHWQRVPRTLFRGERMYSFTSVVKVEEQDYELPEPVIGQPHIKRLVATHNVVGWGSFVLNTRDADDEEASLSVGVFPDAQKQGYRRLIIDFLCDRAAKLGAARMQQLVYKTNREHYDRTRRECKDPASKWIYAGDVWYPGEGYGYFVRELGEVTA